MFSCVCTRARTGVCVYVCIIRILLARSQAQEAMAKRLVDSDPKRFRYHKTEWGKFRDGTDNIEVGGFYPVNYIRGQHVVCALSLSLSSPSLSLSLSLSVCRALSLSCL